MKKPEVLRERGKSLEEQFFTQQSEELKRKLREERTREKMREELAQLAGFTDEATIDRMVELGIGAETWAAVALVPLVEVAWANGQVDDKERRSVLVAAEANGLSPGSPAYNVIEGWLDHRPGGQLLAAWGEYIVVLCAELTPEEKHGLREELLTRARHIAEASGGFWGLGGRISPEEQVVLEELAKAFDR